MPSVLAEEEAPFLSGDDGEIALNLDTEIRLINVRTFDAFNLFKPSQLR